MSSGTRLSHSLRVHLGSRLVACGRGPAVPRCPLALAMTSVDRAVVVELQALGLRERALELAGACGGREIEQCAVDRRDRDAFVVGGVLGIEGARAVQADPRGAVAAAGAVTSMRV